ncbi:MAG: RNA 2',3'-cyclic phosphodiesterase [Bryobacteraceae bacterium]|nr:RNA 2',3'-cyclic phosphodiesterase [Bryobacteraceae bacterium]
MRNYAMRLFAGVSVSYEVRRNIELLVKHLKSAADLKWSPPENLHITTRFVGEWPETRVDELVAALRSVPMPPPFELSIAGLGWHPNPHQPRVFFAGVPGSEQLAALAREIDVALEKIGLPPEAKPFNPHLTLARIKPPVELAALRQAIAALPSADFGRFTVSKHLLFESKPGTAASRYSVIAEFPLA